MSEKEKMQVLRDSLEIIKEHAEQQELKDVINRLNAQEDTNVISDEMLLRLVNNQRTELAEEYRKTSK